MAEPHFANDDDLPRTLRRERDAREREREQRERDAAMAAQAQPYPQHGYGTQDYVQPAYSAPAQSNTYGQLNTYGSQSDGTVSRLEIPFLHLVWFFVKAVFAAIPALLILTALLFAGGQILKRFFPDLRHFEIVIKSADGGAATKDAPRPGAPPAATAKK